MAEVGADIESICGKCGDVWHVVVAKVGNQIAKVQCKMCGGLHRHRPPNGSTARSTSRSTGRVARSSGGGRKTRGTSKSAAPLIQPNLDKPPQSYSIKQTYAPGDRIEHPRFGSGVVEMSVGPQKIQVFFTTGRRVLAHEHTAS